MNRQGRIIFVILILVAGLCLRLWMPSLIEFKWDEAYMWAASQGRHGLEAFPTLGMRSGAGGLRNPGLSVWAFSGPSRLLGIESPEMLARFVGLLHMLSLILLFAYAGLRKNLNEVDRAAWIWAVAATAVQPMILLYTRKIWAQSLLPLPCALIFILWMERKHFPWLRLPLALLCVLIGQIHMSGFFLAAVLLMLELRESLLRRVSIWPLIAGSLLGALPLLAWLREFTQSAHSVANPSLEFLSFRFWNHLVTLGSGLYFPPSLGQHTREFLKQPQVLAALIVSLLAFSAVLARSLRIFLSSAKRQLRELLSLGAFDRFTPTGQLLWATLFAMGLMMTLSNVRIYRHYLLLITPLIALAFVRLTLKTFPRVASPMIALYILLQLSLSIEVLSFLDRNQGAPGADFGTALKYLPQSSRENLLQAIERNP